MLFGHRYFVHTQHICGLTALILWGRVRLHIILDIHIELMNINMTLKFLQRNVSNEHLRVICFPLAANISKGIVSWSGSNSGPLDCPIFPFPCVCCAAANMREAHAQRTHWRSIAWRTTPWKKTRLIKGRGFFPIQSQNHSFDTRSLF